MPNEQTVVPDAPAAERAICCPDCGSIEVEIRGDRRCYAYVTGIDLNGEPEWLTWSESDEWHPDAEYVGEGEQKRYATRLYCRDCDFDWLHDPASPSTTEVECEQPQAAR